MSEIVVLGSGTSNGVPLLGAEYSEAFLANPKNHRTRSSILIQAPKGNILVDCTPDVRFQLLRNDVRSLDAVILTHTHADHVMGMDDLRPFCILQNKPMPVYAGRDFQQHVKRIFAYAFEKWPEGVIVPTFDLKDIHEEFELCEQKICSFWVLHGALPVIGLRVNDVGYVTDVSEIPPKSWEKLQGLDVLILDAVRYEPHPNHFHYEKAIEVAKKLGARQTYFTHLSDVYDHDKVNAELPDGIALAYDGLRVPF